VTSLLANSMRRFWYKTISGGSRSARNNWGRLAFENTRPLYRWAQSWQVSWLCQLLSRSYHLISLCWYTFGCISSFPSNTDIATLLYTRITSCPVMSVIIYAYTAVSGRCFKYGRTSVVCVIFCCIYLRSDHPQTSIINVKITLTKEVIAWLGLFFMKVTSSTTAYALSCGVWKDVAEFIDERISTHSFRFENYLFG